MGWLGAFNSIRYGYVFIFFLLTVVLLKDSPPLPMTFTDGNGFIFFESASGE
jgi:hypothetical protein